MCQVGRKLIAEKIKKLRTNAGMSREELSLKLNLDNSYISKLEKGKINIPIDRLEEIAKSFEINIRDLFT